MKLKEIYTTPPRNEYNENYIHYFQNAPIIDKIHNLVLKKVIDQYDGIHYGLFDPIKNLLISYLHLDKQDDEYIVSLPSTMREYQGQGWMTFLFDYAVLKDHITIVSSINQTPETQRLWTSIERNGRYKVFIVDLQTKEKIIFDPNQETPWQRENRGKKILMTERMSQEDLLLVERHSPKYGVIAERRIQQNQYFYGDESAQNATDLYGPGTSSENWWNP